MPQAGLPLLAAVWFSAVAPVVLIDGIFVLTRSLHAKVPHPLSEVFPFKYWLIYARYDRRYGPNDDAFVIAQSWLNLVEVVLGLLAVLLSLRRASNAAVKLGILVATMTMYKTVLYFMLDVAEEGRYTKHNTLIDQLTMVVIPSSFWIIVPAVIIKQCFGVLALTSVPEPKGKPTQQSGGKQKSASPPRAASQPTDTQQNSSNKAKPNKKK
ncbi:hypothetical protein ABB37_04328 [Leptomonas pyrrhocoris]|uniref:EXPERA domain-containing protein n=1 Tax=Leptomonas pyrrhocoris TaxID=157538 RepID=A0A0M9G287_LEPPY|nr:hypothetical protein ABB37_04328 [Leptomonas pyrrhocoris]XP_015659368.1 hypothetical protein ABB37_04328 [Leptomonas pyrrhocoris]XP_015659369.1 hypothetical protein ABB37_04328 [Leptomonas pyrrhocoris]KPA80928.1 hypothetical protein ABB37_04328 [Leptomonas pyrrhocoris]KPA80929.1 hypothetical protein ABB37_04328 [Leptomonas pyrrhocoris]KPA80930.1 hypothetical protein ABB37_04328 [Leptomonas pyrrhocoris]|eukprot:XP_015659367.1 hypothetical protein ABB37_04328 [Leptomonas pyrrhocoris]